MPDDLWSFWDSARSELADVDMEATRSPAPEHSTEMALVYHVTLTSVGGERITGWFAAPPAPPTARLAGLLFLPSYGGELDVTWATRWAEQGFATLLLFTRGHGPEPFPAGADGKIVHGLDTPEDYAYRGIYLDCLRGLEFLQAQPEVHPHRVAVTGSSQGGGLALATAALAPERVAVAAAHVPLMAGLEWVLAQDSAAGPYGELLAWVAEHPDERAQAVATLAYFDIANLAAHIECPTFVSAGGRDGICPAPSISAAFEAIRSTKSLLSEPAMGHEWLDDSASHMTSWLTHYLSSVATTRMGRAT